MWKRNYILFTDHDHTMSSFVGISIDAIRFKNAGDVVSSWIVVLLKEVVELVFGGAHEACIQHGSQFSLHGEPMAEIDWHDCDVFLCSSDV